MPGVKLWWPLHYGEPNLHTLTATVQWAGDSAGGAGPAGPSGPVGSEVMTKRLGFRSVGLYGTFRLTFHRFDRFELDLRGHTPP